MEPLLKFSLTYQITASQTSHRVQSQQRISIIILALSEIFLLFVFINFNKQQAKLQPKNIGQEQHLCALFTTNKIMNPKKIYKINVGCAYGFCRLYLEVER